MSEQANGTTIANGIPTPGLATLDALIAQLAEEGLVQPLGERPLPEELAPAHDAESTPWYIKVLVGIAAWISAFFLGMFFGAAGLIDTWQSMLIWGGIVGIVALVLKRWLRHSIFWGQLAFALILAGQGLLLSGMAELASNSTQMALAVIGLELLIFALYPDLVHRLLSLLVIVGVLIFLTYDHKVTYLLHGLIWLCGIGAIGAWQQETGLLTSRFYPFRVPFTYGFALALLGLCLLPLAWFTEINSWWPSTVGLAILLLYLAYQVLSDLAIMRFNLVGLWVIGAIGLLLIPALETPGILAALIILVLGRWRSNGLLTGLAATFLLFFLSVYYYNLDLALDEKSYILMGTGLVLLVARFGLQRVVGQKRE